jgi:hypothetical protein
MTAPTTAPTAATFLATLTLDEARDALTQLLDIDEPATVAAMRSARAIRLKQAARPAPVSVPLPPAEAYTRWEYALEQADCWPDPDAAYKAAMELEEDA